MNNEEKAAILLLSLHEEQAAEVMKNLRSSEVRRISKYMSRITSISSKDVQVVAKEFCDLAKEKGGIQSVKEDVAKNIVMRALGPEQAGSIITALDDEKEKFNENPIFEKLRDIDPKLLTDFTKMEHPQTIALILAHLRPEQAAEIMDSLGPEMQIEIVRRMSSLKSVPMELIEDVAQTLEDEIITGASNEKEVGGVKLMADILNRMNRTTESAIISSLDSSDPELAAEIRAAIADGSFAEWSARFRADRTRGDEGPDRRVEPREADDRAVGRRCRRAGRRPRQLAEGGAEARV